MMMIPTDCVCHRHMTTGELRGVAAGGAGGGAAGAGGGRGGRQAGACLLNLFQRSKRANPRSTKRPSTLTDTASVAINQQAIVDRFADEVYVPGGPSSGGGAGSSSLGLSSSSSASAGRKGLAPIPLPAPPPDSRVRMRVRVSNFCSSSASCARHTLTLGSSLPMPSQVRFHNNQPVQLPKGNQSKKYIVEDLTADWDGGSRGKVKLKGKRGPGWV